MIFKETNYYSLWCKRVDSVSTKIFFFQNPGYFDCKLSYLMPHSPT